MSQSVHHTPVSLEGMEINVIPKEELAQPDCSLLMVSALRQRSLMYSLLFKHVVYIGVYKGKKLSVSF